QRVADCGLEPPASTRPRRSRIGRPPVWRSESCATRRTGEDTGAAYPHTERLTHLADTTRSPVGIDTYIAGRLGRVGRAVSRPRSQHGDLGELRRRAVAVLGQPPDN